MNMDICRKQELRARNGARWLLLFMLASAIAQCVFFAGLFGG